MIVLIAFIAGFALGWSRASKSDGDRLDKLQYGFGHGMAIALVTLATVILLQRLGF